MATSLTYAVLMGDLVHSERNTSTESLHAVFNTVVNRQNQLFSKELVSPLTITLGDEFQGLVSSLVTSARIARAIRLDLLDNAIECRFAIGIVMLNTPLNTERAWNMMGPGLATTRERLNEKRRNMLYRFAIPAHPVLQTMLEAIGASLTAIERRWTDTQRHYIQEMLNGASAADVARQRNVSAHTIYKVRGSGDFDLYRLHWNAVTAALAELDDAYGIGGAER